MSFTFNFDMLINVQRYQPLYLRTFVDETNNETGSGFKPLALKGKFWAAQAQRSREEPGFCLREMLAEHDRSGVFRIFKSQIPNLGKMTHAQFTALFDWIVPNVKAIFDICQSTFQVTRLPVERVLIARHAALSAIRSLAVFQMFGKRFYFDQVQLSDKNLRLLADLVEIIGKVLIWYSQVLLAESYIESVVEEAMDLASCICDFGRGYIRAASSLHDTIKMDHAVREASFKLIVLSDTNLRQSDIEVLFKKLCIIF